MMDVLGDLDYVIVYIDGVIYMQKEGELEDDHLEKLVTVMRRAVSRKRGSVQICGKAFLCKRKMISWVTCSQREILRPNRRI